MVSGLYNVLHQEWNDRSKTIDFDNQYVSLCKILAKPKLTSGDCILPLQTVKMPRQTPQERFLKVQCFGKVLVCGAE